MVTTVVGQSWSQAWFSVTGCCRESINWSVARPSTSSAPAPVKAPDRRRTATPVAGPAVTTRTAATAPGPAISMTQSTVRSAESKRPGGTAVQFTEPTPLAIAEAPVRTDPCPAANA
jgi:hypothetical protein